jgi:ABC-type transport system substrate-binding protein
MSLKTRLSRREFLITSGSVLAVPMLARRLPVPGAEAGEKPVDGGTLRVGFTFDPATLDPHKGVAGTEHNILFSLYDTLVSYDKDLNAQPQLAESWETPDPHTYVFKLRKGVKFHDGTPFDAAAVKWNIERHLEPSTASMVRGQLAVVKALEIVDDHTITFHLHHPSATLPIILADRGGMMVSPSAVQKLGEDFGRKPVGAGPFKLTEWTTNVRIVLEKFDDYWNQDQTYLESIVFQILRDVTVRTANLRAGKIDLAYMVAQKDIFALERDRNLRVDKRITTEFYKAFMNKGREPMNNTALRQAISYALDREAILKGIFLGQGEVAQGPLPSWHWAYDPQFVQEKGYRRDPEKAKAKLKEAGYANGLKIEGITPNEDPWRQLGEVVKAQLADIGVELHAPLVDRAETRVFFQQGKGDLYVSRWTGRAEADMTITENYHSKGAFNVGNYSVPGLDALIEQARGTFDRAERTKLYRQIQAVIVDQALDIFLIFPYMLVASTRKLQDFEIYGDGKMHLRSIWMKK